MSLDAHKQRENEKKTQQIRKQLVGLAGDCNWQGRSVPERSPMLGWVVRPTESNKEVFPDYPGQLRD